MSTLQRDLPELWQKPTYDELRDSLENLHVKPPVWDYHLPLTGAVALHNSRPQDRRDINQFITSIISSNLTWIDDEDQREELWTLASKRLSERCGRTGTPPLAHMLSAIEQTMLTVDTAMGEITRRFSFQGHQGTGTPPFDLIIREPPITGESLGLKTWASSYILAQILPGLATAPGGLSHVGELQKDAKPRILELGSGTGLLGLAASCFWHTSVTLTDVPTIVPNLAFNVETNRVVVEEVMGGSIEAASLTWGNHAETDVRFHVPHQYDVSQHWEQHATCSERRMLTLVTACYSRRRNI